MNDEVQAQAKDVPALKTIAVPENVTLEIRRLHLDLVAAAKQFEAKKIAFGEYMRASMKVLGVPTDGSWDLNDAGTEFKERACH